MATPPAVKPRVLFLLPPGWNGLDRRSFTSPLFETILGGHDEYAPESVDYFVGFRPPAGLIQSLPRLKAVFSLGAGVDGFLSDPDFPRHLPLVRFLDPSLAVEMAQYVSLHALMIHRHQRFFDKAQADHAWRQMMLPRASRDTRIGILGLGAIGGEIAARLAQFDFQLCGWSQTRKSLPGIESFAGEGELDAFLGRCHMVVVVLPLTQRTRDFLDADFFSRMRQDAWIINVARGGLLVEDDLLAALDGGHLGGAVLDVFQTEPLPSDNPLWRHPKVTVTPHIAGITDPSVALAYVEDCVRRATEGQAFDNLVDIEKGY